MSKKRFERWNDHSCKVKDNQEGTFLSWEDVVDRLNEQHEQIGRLKGNFRALDEVKCELADENEQLKQGLNDDLELIGQLQEEAEELKQHNTELINKIDFLERVIDGGV